MDKQKMYENVLENYFLEKEIAFDGLKEIMKSVGPVFGELEVKEELTEENEKKMIFKDVDIYDTVLKPDGTKENKVTDMSTIIGTLYVDKENIIKVAEHGMMIFTPANKEKVLVLTSLIGKKIAF